MAMWGLRDASRLLLGDKLYQEFDLFSPDRTTETIRELPGISAINMFVGANHSGKSRFLRSLAQDPGFKLDFGPKFREIKRQLEGPMSLLNFLRRPGLWESNHKKVLLQLSNLLTSFSEMASEERAITADFVPTCRALEGELETLREYASDRINDGAHEFEQIEPDLLEVETSLASFLPTLPAGPMGPQPERIYVPVLRGLRLFNLHDSSDVQGDLYQQRTERDYFSSSEGRRRPEVFTGYALYAHIRDMLLGNRDERRRVQEYENFLSRTLLEGKAVTLTPHKSHVLHVTIDGEEHAIHNVGDGLQSAIILTFEPFVRRDTSCMFFIEEPELFLHPGLQRHILEFFLECKNHLFFFTTHSNHFLGMSFDYEDISIYNFQRNASASEPDKPRFLITPVSRGHQSSLELLGVRNSSVFLVNATIWVEGVTDRRYLRKFLQLYREHCESTDVPPEEDIRRLEEDLHYAFVEYGGANLPHWSFAPASDDASERAPANERPIEVRTLCARAIVIRDDDETSTSDGKKGKRRQNELLRGELGERILLTPGREIENLLPPQVIAASVKQKVPAAQPETWARADYRDQRLGQFLDEKTGLPGTWGGQYGTLKQKTEFCTKAIQQIEELGLTFAELDEEVQEMVKRICRFLVEQNEFAVASRRA